MYENKFKKVTVQLQSDARMSTAAYYGTYFQQ